MSRRLSALALLLVAACGADPAPPTAAEIAAARERVVDAVAALADVRLAADLLGYVEDYDPGASRADYAAAIAADLAGDWSCASVGRDSSDPDVDVITATLAAGCGFGGLGRTGAGDVVVSVRGAVDAVETTIDLRGLTVDGDHVVTALAGRAAVDGAVVYWVEGEGEVPGRDDAVYTAHVELPGLPAPAVTLVGTLAVTRRSGARAVLDGVVLDEVFWRPGETWPAEARLIGLAGATSEGSSGTTPAMRYVAEFASDATLADPVRPFNGELILTIDDHDPVTTPLE